MPKETFRYSNKDITIIWRPNVCIHSKICWHGLKEVFDPARRPWILPEAAASQTIMEQVDKCPSGALSYVINEVSEPIVPDAVPAATAASIIECLPNGPLLVKGDVIVKKSDGTEETKTGTIALCRCGASGNKPYCDGGHRNVGFKG